MIYASIRNKAVAVGTAAAILAAASTAATSAPIGGGQLAVKEAAVSDVAPVSWRVRRNTAIALGFLGGLAIAGATYPYWGPYPYGPYYYGPPPRRRCWQQWGPYRGQGRWVYC